MPDPVKPGDGQGDTKPAPVVVPEVKPVVDAAAQAVLDKAAADKVVADAAAKLEADNKGKTPDEIAAAKTAADKVAADAVAAAAAAKPGAPEEYDIKKPAGADWLDDGLVSSIEKTARAKGLTNDQLQAIVNERAEEIAAQSTAFRAAVEADPTYGGDKLAETQRLSKTAMDKLRPAGTARGDAFRKLLVNTGFGNNLEVVSLFADLGKMMSEDGHIGGDGGKPASKTEGGLASTLYDHPTSKQA